MKLNNLIKNISIIAGCVALALPATASAAAGLYNMSYPAHKRIYLRADIGVAWPSEMNNRFYDDQRPDSSLYYGVGAGYRFDDNWRADITLGEMDMFKFGRIVPDTDVLGVNVAAKQKLKSTLLMLNGYYDLRNGNLIPYITGGLGIAYNDAGAYSFPGGHISGEKKMRLAANIGAGMNVKIIECTSVDFGYKYMYMNKFETSKVIHFDAQPDVVLSRPVGARLGAHTFTVGVRQGF